jgi:hypothetical protein
MNLIPLQIPDSPNYWCTWNEQYNLIADFPGGDEGVVLVRDNLNEAVLFEDPGLANRFLEKERAELFIVLDDGWDVPFGANPGQDIAPFASCIPDAGRFPSFSGTPENRLKQLSDKILACGWKGLGLWIAAQASGETRQDPFPLETLEQYWRARARWCHATGVRFWKVDWGVHAHDLEFRRMLSRVVREEAPGLLVEHAFCMGPFNNFAEGSGRFQDWGAYPEQNAAVLSFSDVFSTYDVTQELSAASTLDRAAYLLSRSEMLPSFAGILNVEDELYLGAALGCSIGVMRHPLDRSAAPKEFTGRPQRMDEVARALRWYRLAPAYGVGQNEVVISEEILRDSAFVGSSYDWSGLANTTVVQSAPAAVARGLALPAVSAGAEGQKPFVVTSRHPDTGAVSVAALPRSADEHGMLHFWIPRANVAIQIPDGGVPIAVFGEFEDLEIAVQNEISGKTVWAQDLRAETAEDITPSVTLEPHRLRIDGRLIDRIGLSAASPRDRSFPGLVLQIK